MKQVCKISLNDTHVPESMNLINPEDRASKLDLKALSVIDPLKICPKITQKQQTTTTKKTKIDQQGCPLPKPIYM